MAAAWRSARQSAARKPCRFTPQIGREQAHERRRIFTGGLVFSYVGLVFSAVMGVSFYPKWVSFFRGNETNFPLHLNIEGANIRSRSYMLEGALQGALR